MNVMIYLSTYLSVFDLEEERRSGLRGDCEGQGDMGQMSREVRVRAEVPGVMVDVIEGADLEKYIYGMP